MTRGLSLTFHYVHIVCHLFPSQYIPFFLLLFLRINLSWHRGNTRNESRWTCIEFPAINCIVTNCERLFVANNRITSTVAETLVSDYSHNEECTTMYSSKSMWLNSYVLTKGCVVFLKRVKEIAKQRKKEQIHVRIYVSRSRCLLFILKHHSTIIRNRWDALRYAVAVYDIVKRYNNIIYRSFSYNWSTFYFSIETISGKRETSLSFRFEYTAIIFFGVCLLKRKRILNRLWWMINFVPNNLSYICILFILLRLLRLSLYYYITLLIFTNGNLF